MIYEIGSEYPIGPCPSGDYKLLCSCETIVTPQNVIHLNCGCEICEYCGDGRCPNCSEHIHCGGCI